MKILFLCQEPPFPPNNGIRIKLHNVVVHMARRGHECDLLCFQAGGSGHPEALGRALEPLGRCRVLGVLPPRGGLQLRARQLARLLGSGGLSSAARWETPAFRTAVTGALRARYDLVHIDMANLWSYAQLVDDAPVVLSINDSLSRFFELQADGISEQAWRRPLLRTLARNAARVEREGLPGIDRVHVVSSEEEEHLRSRAGLTNIRAIPISVEDRYFDIPPAATRSEIVVAMIGEMRVRSIQDAVRRFVRNGWPSVLARAAHAKLAILGGRGTPPVVRAELAAAPNVSVIDWVEDYASFLANADVGLFVDPRPGGMKNRVLQMMAAGRPVLGTRAALEGIAGTAKLHFQSFEDHQGAADELVSLALDEAKRRQLGAGGRGLATERYSVRAVGKAWEEMYEEVVGCAAGKRTRAHA